MDDAVALDVHEVFVDNAFVIVEIDFELELDLDEDVVSVHSCLEKLLESLTVPVAVLALIVKDKL